MVRVSPEKLLFRKKFSLTTLPNGVNESAAILKCCLANGIPMMVMKSSTPKNMCTSHAHKPPKIIQMILSGNVIHPFGLSPLLTSAPKGHRQSIPILTVCNATGMPTMVQAIAKLPVKYPMAASSPPKSHHNKFPIILILFQFSSLVDVFYLCIRPFSRNQQITRAELFARKDTELTVDCYSVLSIRIVVRIVIQE